MLGHLYKTKLIVSETSKIKKCSRCSREFLFDEMIDTPVLLNETAKSIFYAQADIYAEKFKTQPPAGAGK